MLGMKIGGTTTNPRAGLFVPTMKVQPPAPLQLAPQLATEVEVLSPPGPLFILFILFICLFRTFQHVPQ